MPATSPFKPSSLLALTLVLSGLASHAVQAGQPQDQGQDQQGQAPQDGGTSDTTQVTVTGKKGANKIDRQVYETGKDPASQTGSVADALNKVPGVDVDNDGKVTLKGKPVEVYINGHPSLLLSGDNRALALKAMPSKIIDRIEVISNPGAQYGSGSSGGVINIVTKSALPPGHIGNYALKFDSTGGYTPGFFDMRTGDKLTVTGFLGFTRGEIRSHSEQQVEHYAPTAPTGAQSRGTTSLRGHFAGLVAFGSYEYRLDAHDTLGGQANLFHGNLASTFSGSAESLDSSAVTTSAIDIRGPMASGIDNRSLNLNWTHYGDRPDETLKLNVDHSRSFNSPQSLILLDFVHSPSPELTGLQQTRSYARSQERNDSLGLDYNVPVGDDQLAAGVEIRRSETKAFTRNLGPGPVGSDLIVNPALSQFFVAVQTTRAAYLTYQTEIGDRWTLLAGLRAEDFHLVTRQVATGATASSGDTRLNPSFYATYVMSPEDKVRFTYAQRLERPAALDYNDRLTSTDTFDAYAGNPYLKPQITQGFELSYEYARANLTWSLRGYYRRDTRIISSQSTFIPDPQNLGNTVIQTRRINQGYGRHGGLDLYVSNEIAPRLKLEIDAVIDTTAINTAVWGHTRSLADWGGKIALNYTTKGKDQWQVNLSRTAAGLTPQGYSGSRSVTGFQYSHNLTPQVQLSLGGNDIFRTGKAENVILSPLVRNSAFSSQGAPVFFINLTRNFYAFAAPAK